MHKRSEVGRVLYVICALGLSLYFLIHDAQRKYDGETCPPWDGLQDWGGAKVTLEGQDPFSAAGLAEIGMSPSNGIGHPPTVFIWFYPFAHLSPPVMKHSFELITLVMLGVHVALVAHELALPMWPLTALLAFCAISDADLMQVHLAQVDLSELIAFLYVLGWYFLRRGRELSGGAMLGLAATVKLYPPLMVLFLLPARRFRAFAAAAVAYLLFAIDISIRIGPSSFLKFLQQTKGYTELWTSHIRNAAIHGIVHRWFYPLWVARASKPVLLSATLIGAAISLIIFAVAYWVSRPALKTALTTPKAIDLPFALFSILSMAPGPYQWEHYSLTLILPMMLVIRFAIDRARAGNWPSALGIGALLFGLCLMLEVRADARQDVAIAVLNDKRLLPRLLYYEYSTWLPWFVLSIVIGVMLYRGYRTPRAAARLEPAL